MKPFLVKYPEPLKLLYPKRLSRLNSPNSIYLTFDDGPIPEVTPWVLKQLKQYKAKASFFCIGDNIKKHPEIFHQVLAAGHSIGNHTNNHLNGRKTHTQEYLENVFKAESIIKEIREEKLEKSSKKLFRPPYGQIKNSQAQHLENAGYTIVMWDVLSGDFEPELSAEKCYQNVTKNTREGSLIVFHDSLKAFPNLKEVLPLVLQHYSRKEYHFKRL